MIRHIPGISAGRGLATLARKTPRSRLPARASATSATHTLAHPLAKCTTCSPFDEIKSPKSSGRGCAIDENFIVHVDQALDVILELDDRLGGDHDPGRAQGVPPSSFALEVLDEAVQCEAPLLPTRRAIWASKRLIVSATTAKSTTIWNSMKPRACSPIATMFPVPQS